MSEFKGKNHQGSSEGIKGDPKQNSKLCKKYKKVKYEIEMQNFKINQLRQELEAKMCRNFPQKCIDQMNQEIEHECCKLEKMINLAMLEQSRTKDDSDCEWGPISSNDAQFTKPPQTPSDISSVSGIADLELLMSENEALEEERFNLQEHVLERDDSICDLHNRMSCLQQQVDKLSRANDMIACQLQESHRINDENERLKERLEYCNKNANFLSSNLQKTESHMKELRSEINCIKKDKEFLNEFGAGGSQQKCTDDDSNNDKVKCIQDQYEQLLQEYCKKDNEHKEMTNRLKKCLKNNESELEKVENEALRKESQKLISEIEDYRILIKELQAQIDLYRDKFMKAQEKVETQKLRIEKLECSKNSIEYQVNEEIERIKEKFQEKLNELCPYPEKYAESRCELEKSKSRIVVLESNLKDITNELWKAKCELKTLKDQPNDSIVEKYEKMQIAMEEEQKKYCCLKKTKECLEDKLCSMKQELEDLRRDSAKIITTTKCTAEKNRQILHEQINCLEFELAQCRATASLSLTEKEELIKQLQQELNTLCGHFNGCQGQIMQLKDQIEYLTSQRYKESDKNHDSTFYNFSDDLENWMGNLPNLIRDRIPIINLAIPGSHDSGAYAVTRRSKIAPDAEDVVRQLYRFIPWIVRKWAKTQKYSFREQLYHGIRYFDLRLAVNDDDDQIYFVHGVYCDEVMYPLEELLNFLIDHPKEFVILDCQHFYNFEPHHHQKFMQILLKHFNTRIYERFIHEQDFPYLTLSKALNLHKQMFIIYRNQNIDKTFFQSYHFQNPWPNVTDIRKLEEFLDNRIMLRSPYQGYCTQLVLTPTSSFIIRRFYSSLRNKCAKQVDKECKAYLESQKPGPFRDDEPRKSNVFLADFVDLFDNYFPKTVIDLNMKLLP